jgi:hypothetical protein
MDINDFINEAQNAQQDKDIHEKRKKIQEQRRLDKLKADWQRLDDVVLQMKDDFSKFIGVKLRPYYSNHYQGVWKVISWPTDFSINVDNRFKSRDGNLCINIALDDRDYNNSSKLYVQLTLNPETDELEYLYRSKLFKFTGQIDYYMDLPEGRGWKEDPLPYVKKCLPSYEHFKANLMDLIKATVDIESLKKKHGMIATPPPAQPAPSKVVSIGR